MTGGISPGLEKGAQGRSNGWTVVLTEECQQSLLPGSGYRPGMQDKLVRELESEAAEVLRPLWGGGKTAWSQGHRSWVLLARGHELHCRKMEGLAQQGKVLAAKPDHQSSVPGCMR